MVGWWGGWRWWVEQEGRRMVGGGWLGGGGAILGSHHDLGLRGHRDHHRLPNDWLSHWRGYSDSDSGGSLVR